MTDLSQINRFIPCKLDFDFRFLKSGSRKVGKTLIKQVEVRIHSGTSIKSLENTPRRCQKTSKMFVECHKKMVQTPYKKYDEKIISKRKRVEAKRKTDEELKATSCLD